jgi:outer membrane murein-binding lipoprotein Lpp
MNKWLAVAVFGVLLIALVIVIVVFTGQTSDLNAKLDSAEQQVASLQGQVSTLQGNVSSVQSQLTAAQTQATSLQANLTNATGQVSTLQRDAETKQATITSQAAQLNTMKYPRHFATVDELTNWLQRDNTNTLFTNPTTVQRAQMALVLQVKAARDGFLMTVNLPIAGNLELVTNRAMVGDVIYEVRPWDDFAQRWGTISPALPSHPITPESGQ